MAEPRHVSSTTNVTSIAISSSSQQVLAQNSNRLGYSIYADGTLPTNIYILAGAGTASATNYTFQLSSTVPFYQDPFHYIGPVQVIGSSATGNLRVTEYS